MRIVYGVSSVGLGHARRSLTLARNLREIRSDIEISWITAEPGISFLESEGEKILPVSRELKSLSPVMEKGVSSGRLDDMSRVARNSSSIARTNYTLLKEQLANFDVLIQDEFAETMFCFMWDKNPKLPAFRIIITDYLQFESGRSLSPLSRIITWYANRMLVRAFSKASLRIFADNPDSVSPKIRSRLADFEVVGPILPKLPFASKAELRNKIISTEFGDEPDNKKLIVASVGGTSTGKVLVDFLFVNFREISRESELSDNRSSRPKDWEIRIQSRQFGSGSVRLFYTGQHSIFQGCRLCSLSGRSVDPERSCISWYVMCCDSNFKPF